MEPATSADRRALIEVLATAFRNDPPMVALVPNGQHRPAALRRLYGADVTGRVLAAGWSLMARDGDAVVGAALVFPPGSPKPPRWTEVGNTLRYLRTFGSRVLHAHDLELALRDAHPTEPHLHLLYLGAAVPGRGVGGDLLTALTTRADREGLPIYLEASTPSSARLYARHGFQTVRTLEHPVADFTLMWRPGTASVR